MNIKFSFIYLIIWPICVFSQKSRDTLTVIDQSYVYFDSDMFLIKSIDTMKVLDFVRTCQSLQNAQLHLEAHTDSDGSNKYNQNLSKQRAESVYNYLRTLDLDTSRITIKTFGENVPVRENTTAEGKSHNRRVKIKLMLPFRMIEVEGFVRSEDRGDGVAGARLIRHTKYLRDTFYTSDNGKFKLLVPLGEVAGFDAVGKGHFFTSTMMRMTTEQIKKGIHLELPVIEMGRSFSLTSFLFVGNKAILLEPYNSELEQLIDFMQINGDYCINIVGHVNYPNRPAVDSTTFEFNLSVARAKLIHDELNDRGISTNRMYYSGKGNWEMKYPEARSEKEMRENRRVEIIIESCNTVVQKENAPLDTKQYDFY